MKITSSRFVAPSFVNLFFKIDAIAFELSVYCCRAFCRNEKAARLNLFFSAKGQNECLNLLYFVDKLLCGYLAAAV